MNVIQAPKMDSIFDGKETIYSRADGGQYKDDNKRAKHLHIKNDTPLEMSVVTEGSLTTTTTLSMYINSVIGPIFKDWYGSDVFPDNNGNINVNFVFKAINDDSKADERAFMPMGKAKNDTDNKMLNRILSINAMNRSNRTMELTGYGAEAIYDLMINSNRNKVNPDKPESFKNFIAETAETVGYGGMVQNIYSIVTGIDIYKVLAVVFGTTNEDGQVVRKLTPIRPVAGFNTGGKTNYIIDIQTMSVKRYEEAMAEIGMLPMPGAISAVTSRIDNRK